MAHRRIVELMRVQPEVRDIGWLQESLASAVQLELATIPTYLTAYWSVKSGEVQQLILEVVLQEMYHMGLAANLLTGIGGTPEITADAPVYPGPLPGGVRPELTVYIEGLSLDWLENVAMQIEYPEGGPIALATEPYQTIGAFYTAIQQAIKELLPSFDVSKQLTVNVAGNQVMPASTPEEAIELIEIIKVQGEGTRLSPEEPRMDGELAHYYTFAEIFNGHQLVYDPSVKKWTYTGPAIPFPPVYPVNSVPMEGYPDAPAEVQSVIREFQETYSVLLDNLQAAWVNTDPDALTNAIISMAGLSASAIQLMQTPIKDGTGNYGPVWIYRPSQS